MDKVFTEQEINQILEALQPNVRSKNWTFQKTFLGQFFHSLAGTIRWCDNVADIEKPKTCFRSKHIQPRLLDKHRFDSIYDVHLSRYRSLGVWARNITEIVLQHQIETGRFLIYFPDLTLSDGAAQLQSKGYFDAHNIPPWDTWIGYFEEPHNDQRYREHLSYLVSWVPKQFVPLVQAGIEVNPEECIKWLDDCEGLVFKDIWGDIKRFWYERYEDRKS